MSRYKPTRSTLLALNDDVLLAILPHLNALELFRWGLTCKRLYRMSENPKLWISLAHTLRADSISLPFSIGTTVLNADLRALRVATTTATRLHENLQREQPILYHSNIVSPGWFKGQLVRDEAQKCVCLFDGRWIVYRQFDSLKIQHVQTTKSKYIFSVDIQAYASWRIMLSPISTDVALVAVHHDINEEWDIIEITFGATPKKKPKFRSLYYPKIRHLEFLGGGLSVIYTQGLVKLLNHYTEKTIELGQAPQTPNKYHLKDGILFELSVQTGGILTVYARRARIQGETMQVGKEEIRLYISLGATCSTYPPDQFWTETEFRPSSTESQLTIWHRVHFKTRGEVFYASYTIDVPYTPLWSLSSSERDQDEEGDGVVLFDEWMYRVSVVANGTMTIGAGGDSLLLSRYMDQRAVLTVYPRTHLPVGQWRMTDRGMNLPVPQKRPAGNDVHSVRAAWDDVRGIAVLYFPDGAIWVLHYA